MKRWSASSLLVTIAISVAVWAVVAALCLAVGSSGHFGWTRDTLKFRAEPVIIASLVGAALAAAGVVYQAILRNPLADPYLLGVSSGAMLWSYLWQLPFMTGLVILGQRTIGEQTFAFIGALVTVAIVFTLASRGGRIEPITLLLVGVIVNAINGSIFLVIINLWKEPAISGGPMNFLVGGLQTNLLKDQIWTAAVLITSSWIALLWLSGSLNVAMLSTDEATSLGVRIHQLRWVALVVASLITAAAVAISGPIGFIGLICPHLGRLIVGNDQRRLLPVATALGAALLVLADAGSRWLIRYHAELPVGVLTGLLGGPFFLLLLWKSRRALAREAF